MAQAWIRKTLYLKPEDLLLWDKMVGHHGVLESKNLSLREVVIEALEAAQKRYKKKKKAE